MCSFTIFTLWVAFLTICGAVDQDNEVCLTLPRNSNPTHSRSNQGVPGKRGPVGATGDKGVQGQKGEPGEVESCGCNPGDIAELREQVRALRNSQSCAGGLIYNNHCITFAYKQSPHATFTRAEQICSDFNATLAEITSDEMYKVVYEYVKKKFIQLTQNSPSLVRVWLGSSFEPATSNTDNLITLRNGNKVRLENWFPGYPNKGSSHSTRVRLIMRVARGDSTNRGIYNDLPTYTDPAPLCATQLPN